MIDDKMDDNKGPAPATINAIVDARLREYFDPAKPVDPSSLPSKAYERNKVEEQDWSNNRPDARAGATWPPAARVLHFKLRPGDTCPQCGAVIEAEIKPADFNTWSDEDRKRWETDRDWHDDGVVEAHYALYHGAVPVPIARTN